jgi:hypothetical protein
MLVCRLDTKVENDPRAQPPGIAHALGQEPLSDCARYVPEGGVFKHRVRPVVMFECVSKPLRRLFARIQITERWYSRSRMASIYA